MEFPDEFCRSGYACRHGLATGFLLLAWPTWKTSPEYRSRPYRARVIFFLLHLVAYAVLFFWSWVLFTPLPPAFRRTGWCMAAWMLSVLAVGLTWLAWLLPPWRLIRTVRRDLPRISIAFVISAVAFTAGMYARSLWPALQNSTLLSSYRVLRLVDSSAYTDPPDMLIGAGNNFTVEVNPQCSGIEGIALIGVLVLAYLVVFRHRLRFPAALLLLPAAMILMWIANVMRIAALVEIGAKYSPAIALGGFHSMAGTLLVAVVALSVVAFAQHSTFISRFAATTTHAGHNPVAPWLAPFLASLAVGMVTTLFSSGGADRVVFRPPAGCCRCFGDIPQPAARHQLALRLDFAAGWRWMLTGVD